MDAKRGTYIVLYKYALFVGFLGGVCGVLIDIDHIPSFLGITNTGRPAHTCLGILAGIVAVYCLACLGRLFIRMVLKSRTNADRTRTDAEK